MEGGMEGGREGKGGQDVGEGGGEKSEPCAAAGRNVGSKARGGETSLGDFRTSCAKNEAGNINLGRHVQKMKQETSNKCYLFQFLSLPPSLLYVLLPLR